MPLIGSVLPPTSAYRRGDSVHACILKCTCVYTVVYTRVHRCLLVKSAEVGRLRGVLRASCGRSDGEGVMGKRSGEGRQHRGGEGTSERQALTGVSRWHYKRILVSLLERRFMGVSK